MSQKVEAHFRYANFSCGLRPPGIVSTGHLSNPWCTHSFLSFQEEIVYIPCPRPLEKILSVGGTVVCLFTSAAFCPLASLPRRRRQCLTLSHSHDSDIWRACGTQGPGVLDHQTLHINGGEAGAGWGQVLGSGVSSTATGQTAPDNTRGRRLPRGEGGVPSAPNVADLRFRECRTPKPESTGPRGAPDPEFRKKGEWYFRNQHDKRVQKIQPVLGIQGAIFSNHLDPENFFLTSLGPPKIFSPPLAPKFVAVDGAFCKPYIANRQFCPFQSPLPPKVKIHIYYIHPGGLPKQTSPFPFLAPDTSRARSRHGCCAPDPLFTRATPIHTFILSHAALSALPSCHDGQTRRAHLSLLVSVTGTVAVDSVGRVALKL